MAATPPKPKSAAERSAAAAERSAKAHERSAAAAERAADAAQKTVAAKLLPVSDEAQHLVLDVSALTPDEKAKLDQFHKDFKKRILHLASAAKFNSP